MRRLILLMLTPTLLVAVHSQHCSKWQMQMHAVCSFPESNGTMNLIGGSIAMKSGYGPGLSISRFLNRNFSAGVSSSETRYSIQIVDVDLSRTPGSAHTNLEQGRIRALPIRLSIQCYFPSATNLKVYTGFGVDYTLFDDARFNSRPGASSNGISFQNKLGFDLQAGTEYTFYRKWFLSFAIEKLFLSTILTTDISDKVVDLQIEPGIDLHRLTGELLVNPLTAGIGIGFRF